jgi:hypothetical protein
MSFLDEFSFAFQEIKLFTKNTTTWKYGEKIKISETRTIFLWVIQEKKDFAQYLLAKNLWLTTKDFELRCPNNIVPKKWDRVESFWNSYEVIYYEPVIIDWEQDHNLAIVRLNN